MLNIKQLSILYICLASAMWGFDGVVLTPRLFNLDVSFVVFFLHAMPFAVMNLVLYKEYKHISRLEKEDIMYLALIALFGGCIGVLSIVKALFLVQFESLTVVALLQKLQPIFAILLARILLKERISPKFLFWTVLALIGGYLLTFQFSLPKLSQSNNMLHAALYSLLAAFSFGSATVFGKKILYKVSFKTALFYRYGFTTLFMTTLLLFNGRFDQFSQITNTNLTYFVIIGLTTGSLAILLYYYGLRNIKASVSTICELCFPLSSIIFDYLFNGQVLSAIQYASAGLIFFAIYRIGTNQQKLWDQNSNNLASNSVPIS